MCVRRPAAFSSSSRSRPITPPIAAAAAMRASESSQVISGLAARSVDSTLLLSPDELDSARGQAEQLVELVASEGHLLCGRLHLDEPSVARHHDVQVDVGLRVLGVVEVEQELAA